MTVPQGDRAILRDCASRIADIAALPIQREKAVMWRKLNDLERARPMVWLTEHPWHELNVNDELTLRCESEWARKLEQNFRRELYNWNHLRVDMIVSDYIPSPIVIHDTGYGLSEDVDVVRTDSSSDIVSRHFNPQIVEPEDVEKIRTPELTLDEAATAEEYETRSDLFAGIMPVRKVGAKPYNFSPWDNLIRFWGVEQAMMDLVLRPDMVNAAVTRWVDAGLAMIEQREALHALSSNNDNTRIGSGGYGYTGSLPAPDTVAAHTRRRDMWGGAAAQIFCEVSPDMHWEFALRHELRWLECWGLTYYGCCEPLDRKVDILRRIPNLRKVSMSPKVDPARGAEALGRKYVYSMKPNPAILAEDSWRPQEARRQLKETLAKTRDCNVEIILKDISTVRYQPQRLWDWAQMAVEVAAEFG